MSEEAAAITVPAEKVQRADCEEGEQATPASTSGGSHDNAGQAAEGGIPLTKSQLKKQRRLERRMEAKQKKRDNKKRKKEEAREQRRGDLQDQLEALGDRSDDEAAKEALLAEVRERKKQKTEANRKERQDMRDRLHRAIQGDAPEVCIDLAWSHLMGEREMVSLRQQIMYSYSVVSRSTDPVHLRLSGLKKGDPLADLVTTCGGFENWICSKSEGDLAEVYGERLKTDVVYLTADAEDVIEKLERGKVYVIGGLIDRNRHKGVCFKKAQELGCAAAKLPVRDVVEMSGSHVLTVNQVVEILTKLHASGDIAGAVSSAVPTRKQHAAPSGSEDGEEEKRTGEGGGEGEGEEEKRRGKEGGEE